MLYVKNLKNGPIFYNIWVFRVDLALVPNIGKQIPQDCMILRR